MSAEKARILIVDDEPINLKVLADLLRGDYALSVAKDGVQALARMAADPLPDLVLLDVMMPQMDGHEVCRRLKLEDRTRDVPVIFVTAMGQTEDETRGFEIGAVDYITKPISPSVVMARVRTHVALREARHRLQDQNHELEDRVAERTREVVATQDVTIRALASLAETRDNETGNHIRRTQRYVRVLAEQLRNHPDYAAELDDRTIDLLFKSAPLHDIGKVGIPDAILLKPGKLDDHEFAVMKTHVTLGRDALMAAEGEVDGQSNSFLRVAREIAFSHHEKWDGGGYPEGLAGTAIPLSARLMAVADVYDALISKRIYKPSWPHDRAVATIHDGRGTHFDPVVLDAFRAVEADFQRIAGEFSDHE